MWAAARWARIPRWLALLALVSGLAFGLALGTALSASADVASASYGFEGSVQGWTTATGSTLAAYTTAHAHGGTGALSYSDNSGTQYALSPDLTSGTQSSQTVTVAGWALASASDTETTTLYLSWLPSGSTTRANTHTKITANSSTWTQATLSATIPAGASSIRLGVGGPSNVGTMYWDDVALTAQAAATASPTATATPTPTPTATPTPTPTATATGTASPTPTPTATATGATAVTSPDLDALVVVAEYLGAFFMVVLGLITARLLRG